MSSSPEPPATVTKTFSKKRASDANDSDEKYVPGPSAAAPPAKKRARVSKAAAKLDDASISEARALVARALAKPATFQLSDDVTPPPSARLAGTDALCCVSFRRTPTMSYSYSPSMRDP